jgi:cytochrome c
MKKTLSAVLFALCSFVFASFASAADKGTADEAMALVKKASAYMKANGKEKAIAEFNNPKGQFVDRDLYIFAIDAAGLTVANGSNAKLVGKNVMEMKDQDDKPFIKKFMELGASAGKGWVDYRWINPVSQKLETKSTYIEKVDGLIIGCGIYK